MQGTSFAPGSRAEGPLSEDCLYLNVYTPAPDARRRPVMVWIHGGAFIVGSANSPLYDGGRLAARHDVVVVTLNYRLGALGFLALGDDGARWDARPNLALLDQIAGLRWVRDNIAQFGGDPENVTLFGESAGGTSVCLLLLMDAARGLFHRAIAQSPAAPLELASLSRAARATDTLLAALGLTRAESERLQHVPIEELMRAQAAVEARPEGWPHFFPVVDPATLPRAPREVLAAGDAARVPLFLGSNRDEWNLFALLWIADWAKPLEDDAAIASLEGKLPRHARQRAAQLLAAYRASRSARGLLHDNRALLRAIEGDLRFGVAGLRFAEAHTTHEPRTFRYLFTYESPAMRGALKACHALELGFVFGTLDAPNQDRFAGSGERAEALSRAMMHTWAAFARTGVPEWPGLGPVPPFDTARRTTLVIDHESAISDAPFAEELRAWEGIL